MDKGQEICSRLWTIYRKFRDTGRDNESWDHFLERGRAVINQYQGADKALAEDMFLAFVAYLEKQGIKEYNTHGKQET